MNKLKVLDHKRQYIEGKLEEVPDEIFIDATEHFYCQVCRKKKPPPSLAYEPEDIAYSMGICKDCLIAIVDQIKNLGEG